MSKNQYPAEEGTWTLISPSGRKWEGSTPLNAAAAEQRERIPASVALEYIFDEFAKEENQDILASKLIDTWIAEKGKRIPWAKAVQIIAIVTRQSDGACARLLRLGDEDGACEMCGRRD